MKCFHCHGLSFLMVSGFKTFILGDSRHIDLTSKRDMMYIFIYIVINKIAKI